MSYSNQIRSRVRCRGFDVALTIRFSIRNNGTKIAKRILIGKSFKTSAFTCAIDPELSTKNRSVLSTALDDMSASYDRMGWVRHTHLESQRLVEYVLA